MKTAIRMFALFVAFAGLASASFTAATMQALSSHPSMAASDPGPATTLPGPVPCQLTGTCFVPSTSTR